ncbi:MAG TPA: serine--tRNA ligase [Nitrospirae bacterium]|nr:serine--tRNA ligase [Nitrospirota bacterium]
MLDIKLIRENAAMIRARLSKRGGDYGLDALLSLDAQRLRLIQKTEQLKQSRNELSANIGEKKKSGENSDIEQAKSREIGGEIKALDESLKKTGEEIESMLLSIPNIPHESTPDGEDEAANREVLKWGEIPKFSFAPKSHVELGESLGILDFGRAAKIAGARFSLAKGPAAEMERALINFMLEIQTKEHGYTEVAPPFMVNTSAMTGSGQLPKFADDLFKIENSDYWLIPTAEVPVTNILSGELLDLSDLPISYAAYTPCFRAEAGSYGKDTIGLIRQHQFSKVELVKFTAPEDGERQLERILKDAEEILRRLNLPYRVVTLCSGDLGFSAAKTYDIEVWVPSQNKYREISSCSWFTDYQARRINLRFRRDKKSRPQFVHTLNGSGLAVGRTMVAVMENYQLENGSIEIPKALRPYMGGLDAIV